ncbi:hypothetical protein J1605_011336 [Eschrichtius robustus]|uniref:Uncharacterized protein n=1 Tax=Eschrichtius robustus TaxID=9764 RepID=A0AB34GLE1_ESCRO|nr:hypothetical protein J1605_011336 [Eschrichtius robustus]
MADTATTASAAAAAAASAANASTDAPPFQLGKPRFQQGACSYCLGETSATAAFFPLVSGVGEGSHLGSLLAIGVVTPHPPAPSRPSRPRLSVIGHCPPRPGIRAPGPEPLVQGLLGSAAARFRRKVRVRPWVRSWHGRDAF